MLSSNLWFLGRLCVLAAYLAALHFGLAYLIMVLPRKWFRPECRMFLERPFERALYRRLNVAKWKDTLPEAGCILGFPKRILAKGREEAYIDRFIEETCVTEVIHLVIGLAVFASVALVFFLPEQERLRHLILFLICAILNFTIQFMYICIQRYNRPKLVRVRNLLHQRQAAMEEAT